MTEPPPLSRQSNVPTLLIGMVVANVIGGILCFGVTQLVEYLRGSDTRSLIIYPSLVLLPLLVGLIAAWFYRRLDRSVAITFLDALWISLVGVAGATVVLGEGAVCLVIASPALYLLILTGLFIGRISFRSQTRLQVTIIPLVVLLMVADAFQNTEETTVVTDQIAIRATPAQVWPHVLAFPIIPDPPDYWIFRLGLPYPTQTTNGGNYVGADRQCMFSDGIVIKEQVAEFVPEQKLTFDIIEQPTHPEAYGHITLHRGQFVLRDNGDGTTTLFGSSWYTLQTRPRWYFDLWAKDMTRAVHLRVMNHVRRLAEKEQL